MERNASRSQSHPSANSVLRSEDSAHHPLSSRAWGPFEMFAEGPWQEIRVRLECQGWSSSQIERIHDQLRQGWPLPMATHNVATMTGHCPLRSGRQA